MLIHDHINFLGTNPLIGAVVDVGVRFPDMTEVYDKALRQKIRDWAQSQNIRLQEGIYLATTGPSFETPAEIRAFATLGADAVGMSTVPDTVVEDESGNKVREPCQLVPTNGECSFLFVFCLTIFTEFILKNKELVPHAEFNHL